MKTNFWGILHWQTISRSIYSIFDRGNFFEGGWSKFFHGWKSLFECFYLLALRLVHFTRVIWRFWIGYIIFDREKIWGGEFFSHGKKLNFRAFLPLRLRFRSFDTYKLCLGQFTALLTVEIFSRGGIKIFPGLKMTFWVLLPLGP